MRTTRIIGGLVGLASLAILPTVSRGMASVGDQIDISFQTVDGKTVDLKQLRGKLVVMDFWATWCGPCMAAAPHMVEMNQKYGPKGLVMLGISLDQDKGAMLQTIQQKGMAWPEYFDGQVWNNKLFKMYGGNGIPFTMLLSTKGKVLYAGHPEAGLEQAIEKAFKDDPPSLVDRSVLASAKEALDAVQKKLDAGDAKGAIKLMSKVPATARADEDFAAKAGEVQKKLEDTAKSMLDEAKGQIDSGKYVEAAGRLKELSDALSGLPAATQAKKMLSDLMAKPEAKAAIAQAEKETKANAALEVAQKLQATKKDEQAYPRFKDVAEQFAGTAAGDKAVEQVKKYEADEQFIKHFKENAASSKAKSAMKLAASYKSAGRIDLARKKYQSVVDDFPGTSYADEAQKAMDALPSE